MEIIKIGRDSNNDIVIDDPTVTRDTHCQIIRDDNGNFYIIDGSLNGTYINGTRVGHGYKIQLKPSDIVKVGNTPLPWISYFPPFNPEHGPIGGNQPTKPDNFLVWAILATIFCCVPFGIVSIVKASNVDKYWYAGDHENAAKAAKSARTWFWWAFAVGIVSEIIFIILTVAANF